ncbi:hypothetical protein ACI2L4_10080 [Streptomyces sparsogenes]|uniref:hypothetical protein n=1 Tax=Streptomyces sparsogenes TaxID=67365 RepID=UPI00384E6928
MLLRIRAETRYRASSRLPWLLGLTTTFSVLLAPRQAQANDASDWACKNIPFADKVCNVVDKTNEAIDFAGDPLGYIAKFFRNAVTSIFRQMIKALVSTTRIDWQDPGFLRTYAMAFAASSLLTVILWLITAAKRALQGVPPLQALGESVGFLLMSVMVSAFAPAAVAYVVKLFDQAAEAMLMPVAEDAADMVVGLTTALLALLTIPGGAIIVIFFCLALLAAIAGVWLELIVRNALILSGLVFGPTVFSGLVDRDLWGHTKRWCGVMIAVIASKYVTFTVIALASGLLASDSPKASLAQSFGTVFTAMALFGVALYMPFQLSKFIPILGDELQGMYAARDDLKGRAQSVGSTVGDSYGELKSRFGGSSGGGSAEDSEQDDVGASDGEALDGRPEATGGAEAAAAASPGAGGALAVARKGVDTAKDQAEEVGERDVDGTTAGLDSGSSSPSAGGDDSSDEAGDSPPLSRGPSTTRSDGSPTDGELPAVSAPPSWPPPEHPDDDPPPPADEEMR